MLHTLSNILLALFNMHACHMHMHFIVSHQSLMDAHFPNMETVAGSVLYFDGTRGYTAVACSFAAFGGSYAPACMYVCIHASFKL